jgi:type II secretory pathway pseudopilin PulG
MKRSCFFGDNRKGQVWVETVIYTLIGLAIIGLLLAVARPKINEMKDKLVIEQAIEALGNINDKIYEVQRAAGNQRSVDLKVGRGKFVVDSENDKIYWIIDSNYEYSEPGYNVSLGAMTVLTSDGDPWDVRLEIEYGVDIRYDNETTGTKELMEASAPYKFYIKNLGNEGGNLVIDLVAS